MRHRHLNVPAGTAPEQLGAAAVDDLLDRGDLDDWAELQVDRDEPFSVEIVFELVARALEAEASTRGYRRTR